MKNRRLAKLLTLLAAILFCLGIAAPGKAQDPFTITLTKSSQSVCHSTGDTSHACNIDSAAGPWSFSVTVHGRVNFLQLQIKNNPGPGDICFHMSFTKPSGTFSVPTPIIPAAATNACGDQYTDTNSEPLAVFAYFQGDANASVSIIVTYPAETALNRTGLQQGTLAKLRDQGSTLAQWTDPVVDVCRRRVLLG